MKKIINMKKTLAILGLMVLTFSSCLKEKYRTDFTAVPNVVEQPFPGYIAQAIDLTPGPQELKIWVNLAAVNPMDKDLTVTITQDQAAIDAYNTANNTSYEAMPDSTFTIASNTVVIPAGQREAFIPVTIFPSKIDLTVPYLLSYTITDAQGVTIAENRKNTLVSVLVKNAYDGIYHAEGTMVHPSFPGPFSRDDWELSTAGPTTVEMQLKTTVVFGVILDLTVNADNSVTITTGSVVLDPYSAAENYYDPANKTFHLHFSYSGGSRVITAVATWLGPR
jgi:hypothetical protein